MKKYDLTRWYDLFNFLVAKKLFTHDEIILCMCLLTNLDYDNKNKGNERKINMISEIYFARYGERLGGENDGN